MAQSPGQSVSLHDGIDRMVLIYFEDVDMATKFLSSLQSPMLDWPTKATLTPFCPTSGSVRALLTETYKPVSGPIKMESPGLGITPQGGPFRSYIGYDRRI